jgi:zinc transport system permease protein
MVEFLDAIRDPDIPFLRYALLAGILVSVASGIVGTYVVTRRISYIAAAISHCVLGGIGAAVYLQKVLGLTWCDPMYGAVAAALASALAIGWVSLYARQREDTAIGALWAIGMAVGLMFFAAVPGYVDPMSYLFGDILLIGQRDLWLVGVLDVLVVVLAVGFYNKLLAACFDEEFAQLRGIRVKFYYLLLLCLTALTVVLLVRVVGIVMVIGMLTLPAAVAGHFSRQLWHMMALAAILCTLLITAGLGLSYSYDLPSGPMIIVIAGGLYLAVAVGSRLRRARTA